MKALIFKRYGKPDQIAFVEIPRPTPKPNEILVQVHAAGLNPITSLGAALPCEKAAPGSNASAAASATQRRICIKPTPPLKG